MASLDTSIQDQVRQYLLQQPLGTDLQDLANDESLLEAGAIDSASMVDLICFLESTFKMQIEEEDMIPENFDSIDAIAEYVQSKQ
ncbi:Phosphopantetheine attachment site [Planctomycetales bacterium 10988]|nr:Phosphopantetheine attachment site [Planctomycetales bacterium 10988]